MPNNNLTADSTNIVSIQLNLFDWYDERPDFNEVLNNKITGYTDLDLENGVVLTSPNHFEFDSRRCPKCGKLTLIKKKFVPRKAILDKIGDVVFYLKEYFCKTCHKYPKVELKNILKEYTKVSIQFLENMYNKARTGTKSLRKTSKDLVFDDDVTFPSKRD
jgi:predicted nucleic-acid-binding Zn-ribbon protein